MSDAAHAAGPETERLERRLAARRRAGWCALFFERLWPVLWPPLGVVGAFVCLALLGIPPLLPPLGQVILLLLVVVLAAGLLGHGLLNLKLPRAEEVDRRLERQAGLAHRPLAVLFDKPAVADAEGGALWRAHLARSARQIGRLRVGLPHPGLARRDRRALRGGLVVALAACAGIAGTDAPSRIWAALHPTLPHGAGLPATEVQAWITPPAYTALPPVFLKSEQVAVSVPAGSRLTVSLTGGEGTPRLELAGARIPFRALDSASFQADQTLTAGGRLVVGRGGRTLARWDVSVIPDHAPMVAWAAPPGPGRAALHTRFPWHATDDYGVTALAVELRLRERPDAPPVIVQVPLPGNAKDAHGIFEQDLSAHPWAGLPVTARLVGRNGANQVGRSDAANLVLPERTFRNPEARALIAIRKGLSLHPDDRETALAGLDALLVEPRSIGKDTSAYVNLAGIYYLLEFDHGDQAIPDAQDRLWRLALHLEEGAASQTERAMQAALQAAKDALERMRADPTQQRRADLEAKLRALQEAIARHMQALAEQYRKGELPPFAADPNQQQLSQRDLQRMAQQAMDAAKQGNTEQAERSIAQLEQALDALRNAHPMTAQERAAQAQRQKGRQQMSAMQDLLGRQGGLLDHAQGRTREKARSGEDAPNAGGDRTQDSQVQQALRRALGEVMQQLGDMTGKIPPSLGEADRDMQGAATALKQGQDGAAQEAELKAIQALQKGGHEASQQLADKFGRGQQQGEGQGDGSGDQMYLTDDDGQDGNGDQPGSYGMQPGFMNGGTGRGRDPLGRRAGPGGNGMDEADDVTVPDKAGPKRTEEIEQELRRRDAQRTRPREELDYIERLLKQF